MQEPDDRKKVPEIHDMYIDIGALNRTAAEKLVRVGNAITIQSPVTRLASGRIAARGCDNRIGTWSTAEALRLIAEKRDGLVACIVAASTIQEENGLYGARMAAYRSRPDAAVVVDVTHATDIPSCAKAKHGDVRMGGGPVVSVGSANHPVLVERLRKVSEEAGIPLQTEINPRQTGTDADAIFLERGGIPTISLGLPNRYMHSSVEVIDLLDLSRLAELMAQFALGVAAGERFEVDI